MKTALRLIVLSLALIVGFSAGGPLIHGKDGPQSYAASEIDVPFVPIPIGFFEVTWTLNTRGYETYANIVVRTAYETFQKRSAGWTDHKGFCKEIFSITYKGGGIAEAEGINSVGDPALFGQSLTSGPGGMVCRRGDGSFEIRLGGPGIKALNMASEEALGCWGADWPVMRMSPATFRELTSEIVLGTRSGREIVPIKWEGPAMTPEQGEGASGCEEGSVKIELHGKLPKIVTAGICKEHGGVVTAPTKGKSSKRCKGKDFDGFWVE